jgi:hypothetical protein
MIMKYFTNGFKLKADHACVMFRYLNMTSVKII